MFVYFFSTATHHILTADSSVLNAAALSIAGLRRSAHITNTLASFHWLRAPSESSSNWRHRLPSSSQDCATVTVWSVEPLLTRRLPETTSVVNFQPTYCPSVPSCHSWWTIICFCSLKAVEQSSKWHYYTCFITDSVSTKTENTFISAVIGHYYVACLWLFSPWWP